VSSQIEEYGAMIILGNTYHLGNRPGGDMIEELGGLHSFMNWKNNILTDSGGFQMVSLLKLAEITEEGVRFESPHDGSQLLLTPEMSIHLQNQLGSDIMMALDDVVSSQTVGPRVEEAMHRTIRWIDRCITAHANPQKQNLFGIVQGGLDPNLRKICAEELIKRDLPGYAIGGLSGGESKDLFWKIVSLCTDILPENKPRYLMGVGYPVDMVTCVALGVDMFDCVYPTRTARFGTALVDEGVLILKLQRFEFDYDPIDKDCSCSTCKNYNRSFIHQQFNLQLGGQLITIHNIAYQLNLMKRVRQSIIEGTFENFVQSFMLKQFPEKNYPTWVEDALNSVNIKLIK